MKKRWPKGVHLIGVGGIGMSSLAHVLLKRGVRVTGSDLARNGNAESLIEAGAEVFIGHEPSHVGDVSLVVTSTAVPHDNVEVMEANNRNIPVWHRSELLAAITAELKSVAISGTHGKTSTTSMMGELLEDAKLDPTIINGGIINRFGSNAKIGEGEWCVAEADESDGSFTRFFSNIAIITNMNLDHMDHYGAEDELRGAFQQFINNLKPDGLAVLCVDHERVRALYDSLKGTKECLTYGFTQEAQVRATHMEPDVLGMRFHVTLPDGSMEKDVILKAIGEHNVQNALSVIAVAHYMNIPADVWRHTLKNLAGVQRRFTQVGQWNDAMIIDDYAHHPVEVKAVLNAARARTKNRVLVVMEPHRYSRLHQHMEAFAEALQEADQAYVLPVYEAGETPIEGVSNTTLATCVGKNAHAFSSEGTLVERLSHHIQPGDLVICMGAGKITYFARSLESMLKNKNRCCA